ncbi:hypothetical protein [Pantoea dispersa]|uniref:hypothetical protein n=1 Tax=Pantoea dispersa TaxID=59814 RepID=UPI0024AEEF99|nr:hypothetical protein [Pantoea dispersa]MDI6634319.1 hypothetical protein [Pantoea dispersa]
MSDEISNERLELAAKNGVAIEETVMAMAKELLALRNAREGWRLVPVEPTRQMMSQGHFAMAGTDRGKFRRIYMAMVAAAPESPC